MAKKQETEIPEVETWVLEENPWYQKARQTAEALLDRPAFSYDPGTDPLYQAAKQQTLRLGRRAMADTMGKAAGLTGGYASSYAQSLGAQAYQSQLDRLAERLPDYYDRARSAWEQQTGALRDELSTALGLYDKDYQAFLDRQSARERAAAAAVKQDQWEREFAADQDHWERNYASDLDQWERKYASDKDQWEREFAADNSHWSQSFADDHERWTRELAQKAAQWEGSQAASAASQAHSDAVSERSYAYRMAMLALQQGLSVSDSLLQTAGIDKSYAETIRRYYAALRP